MVIILQHIQVSNLYMAILETNIMLHVYCTTIKNGFDTKDEMKKGERYTNIEKCTFNRGKT